MIGAVIFALAAAFLLFWAIWENRNIPGGYDDR